MLRIRSRSMSANALCIMERDLGILAFNSALWTRMAEADKIEAITLLDTQLQEYYEPPEFVA